MKVYQVNVTTKVNSQSIRREKYNGKEHWILPSYTLPANVIMNGGLYTAEQIDKHYEGLEGTLAPLGHPEVNGQFVSAFSPEGINQGHIGAWNRNAKKAGNRIYVEKWIDIEVAKQSEKGRELIDRIEAIERGDDVPPIHTSIAVFLEQLQPNEEQKQMGAEWVADIKSVDHDAILLHEVGAATPEQGVGMMVNADQAVTLKPVANKTAMDGESFRRKEQLLDQAARKKFINSDDDYAWVADFTDTQAIVLSNGEAMVYTYSREGDTITFEDNGTPVQREESWVTMAMNTAKRFIPFFGKQDNPATNQQEGDMPLTPEEKQELITEIGKGLAANVAEAVKPIVESVNELKANTDEKFKVLTANHDAEEARKRETVKEKFGEVVANSLQGDALDDMFKQCGSAAPLGVNSATQEPEAGAPEVGNYFNQ
ncbi:hypothetical protein PP410_gp07 [Vibrio phage NF]|uniref:DUF2213 domain-containing protein n=1 Tax=Vibrio phage NF TaxID=2686202 RepID=A0A896Q7N8_9CAUD|nr:hypothetical protein PP410_gp07 [Vibrio phage NF]QSD24991.1 hypothetical protein [Vibrio phage NF]